MVARPGHSLMEASFNKGLWMVQSPGDNKAPEDRPPLTKTISLGKMAEIRTLTSWGLLFAVALAVQLVISSGEGVNPRSSNWVRSGRVCSLDVFRKLF